MTHLKASHPTQSLGVCPTHEDGPRKWMVLGRVLQIPGGLDRLLKKPMRNSVMD
jgi:hypothetical protein